MVKRKQHENNPDKEKKSAKKHKKERKDRKIKKEEESTTADADEHDAASPRREQHEAYLSSPVDETKTMLEGSSAIDSAGRVRSGSMTLEMSYEDLHASTEDANNCTGAGDDSFNDVIAKAAEDNPTFFQKRVQLTVSLLPYSLRNSEASIRASIRKQLLRHSDGWEGVMLAFDNVKYRDRNAENKNSRGKGWILNELPHIHYEVDCDVLVFAPTVGCELQGIVSECFPSHISILVFGYINAMVPAETFLKTGYKFDSVMESWVEEDGSQAIAKGMKINFRVSKIHECEGTISLEGTNASRALLMES